VEITEVRVNLRNENKLKAFASIVFDDAFIVRNLKVIKGDEGYFVSMPNRKCNDGKFRDVAHPINNEMRKTIEYRVLNEYERMLNNEKEELSSKPVSDHTSAVESDGEQHSQSQEIFGQQ
jgi:stage V sporulation protein G